jgi:hypothetical protein
MASAPWSDPQSGGGFWDMEDVKEALRRLVGDAPHSNVPEALRTKGVIYEMREEFRKEMRSQRAALLISDRKREQRDRELAEALVLRDKILDKQFTVAQTERNDLTVKFAEMEKGVRKLRNGQHIIISMIRGLWRWTWSGTKDDRLTVGFIKIGATGTVLGIAGTAVYHIGSFFLHKAVPYLERFK